MILATHALTGAVIGKTFSNPLLVIILSLIVHFLMDPLRHGEYFDSRTATIRNTAWKVALDLLIAFATVFIYVRLQNPDFQILRNIFLGMFFSMLPDGMTLLNWKYPRIKILQKIKSFHELAHYYKRFPKFSSERQWTMRNEINDIIISAIAITLLFL